MRFLKLLLSHVVLFFLGVALADTLKSHAPRAGRALRPVAKGVLREGLVLGRKIQTITEEVREDLEDLTAESASELEARGKGMIREVRPAGRG